jgi:RNA polymerase sigma-70 factor (ECF subfamily)
MTRRFNQIMSETRDGFRSMTREYAPEGEAEDLYQEIVCEIWKSIDSFEGRSAPATWAWGIALNRACTYRKKRVRRARAMRKYEQEAQSGQEGGRGEEQILAEFTRSLAVKDRNIFMMYQTELGYAEIAQTARISMTALHSRLKRLKRQFKQRYL